MVDLGLPSGLKWAKCNVGAEKETDYGLYFQWGEVVGHDREACNHMGWSTAPFNGGSSSFSWFYFNRMKDTVCPNGVLALEYDAACQNMGEQWRMPTSTEVQELKNNTNQEVTDIDGVKGMKFISKVDSSKYIFVPFAGYCGGGNFSGEGRYSNLWSSSLYAGDEGLAYRMGADSDGKCYGGYGDRYDSFIVRGVHA